MLGDDIELYVVGVENNRVKLGIKAPSGLPIHRKELYEKIKKENKEAFELAHEYLDKFNN